MGRWLGLAQFHKTNEEANTMKRGLQSAAAFDRRVAKKSDQGKAVILAAVKGVSSPQMKTKYREVMLYWICNIRGRFAGAVIRRTMRSLDYSGTPISLLAPYTEHLLVIKLYHHEILNLEQLAYTMVKDGAHRVANFGGGSVSN
jgi:hypothetical protein